MAAAMLRHQQQRRRRRQQAPRHRPHRLTTFCRRRHHTVLPGPLRRRRRRRLGRANLPAGRVAPAAAAAAAGSSLAARRAPDPPLPRGRSVSLRALSTATQLSSASASHGGASLLITTFVHHSLALFTGRQRGFGRGTPAAINRAGIRCGAADGEAAGHRRQGRWIWRRCCEAAAAQAGSRGLSDGLG